MNKNLLFKKISSIVAISLSMTLLSNNTFAYNKVHSQNELQNEISQKLSLVDVYNLVLKHNADLQAAKQQLNISEKSLPLALASLLPTLSMSLGAVYNYDKNPNKYLLPGSPPNREKYWTESVSLTLSQSIFDWSLWKAYSQADYEVKLGTITFLQVNSQIMLETAKAYFSVLEAQDYLRYSTASEKWNKELYEQMKEKFKAGLIAITDLEATNAQYLGSIATKVAAQNSLDTAKTVLFQLTGKRILHLKDLNKDFDFMYLSNDKLQKWIDLGLESNFDLSLARINEEISNEGYEGSYGGFLPTFDLDVTWTRALSHKSTFIRTASQETVDTTLTANYNIYNGGSDKATLEQSYHTLEASKFNTLQTERNVVSSITQAFLNVQSDRSQIKAYKEAVLANQSAVSAMQESYNVGIVSIIDLLDQETSLLQAQQNYSSSKYKYILDKLNLKYLARILVIEDFKNL